MQWISGLHLGVVHICKGFSRLNCGHYFYISFAYFQTDAAIIDVWDNAVAHIKKVIDKNPSRSLSSAIEAMLKTGRMVTQSGLDLQQVIDIMVTALQFSFQIFKRVLYASCCNLSFCWQFWCFFYVITYPLCPIYIKQNYSCWTIWRSSASS